MKYNLTIDEKHIYRIGDTIIPSVTQILLPLSNFHKVNKGILDASRSFGSVVHETLHLYDTFNLEEYDPKLEKYIAHWELFKKEHSVEILQTEQMLYSREYQFAGTPDRVANVDGKLSILDIKTGQPASYVGLQLAGYALLAQWEFKTNFRFINRHSVFIDDRGYKLKLHHKVTDKNEFLTLLYARNIVQKYKGGN